MNKDQLNLNLFENGEPSPKTKKTTEKKKPSTPKKDSLVEDNSGGKPEPLLEKPLPEATLTVSVKHQPQPVKMKQAVISWLLLQKPSGIGLKVPTRIRKYQSDIAAFWSIPDGMAMRPHKTVLIEIRYDRDHCWPDCGDRESLLKKLRELKERKLDLQMDIRDAEPELRDCDNLFEEFQYWNYNLSKNPKYHKCLKQIDAIQHSLYRGSRLENIRQARAADFLYVAVPEGVVHRDELADGWGLLYVTDEQRIKVVKMPERQLCSEDKRLHLIQNIGAGCLESILFANGIRTDGKGNVIMTRLPCRRRK